MFTYFKEIKAYLLVEDSINNIFNKNICTCQLFFVLLQRIYYTASYGLSETGILIFLKNSKTYNAQR